ncbi:MAG: PD-(D/E)XK nuclease family protein [Actinomycetota bacterium]|nr:PD-(D/E)XK nuclease family protein [Actinomycetota bacterium]
MFRALFKSLHRCKISAYLLDPRGNHGLGDAFVKRLLQGILMAAGDAPVSVTQRA